MPSTILVQPAEVRLSMAPSIKSFKSFAPQRHPLLDMPNEMIQKIASYLPEHQIVALCLASKRLLRCLGDERLTRISFPVPAFEYLTLMPRAKVGQEDERWKLLGLLDREMVDYILCHDCHRLHKPGSPHLKVKAGNYYMRRFNPYYPDYVRVQYAMKCHRLGRDTQDALRKLDERFSKLRLRARTYDPVPSLEGRIVSVQERGRSLDKLYVEYKIERILPMRISSGLLEGSDKTIKICTHMQRQLRVTFECQVVHYYKHEAPCKNCEGMRHCEVCKTEFLVEIDRLPDPYAVVAVRAWQDLGQGLTPHDPVWWSHAEERIRDVDAQRVLRYQPGSIRRVFEAAGPVEDDWY